MENELAIGAGSLEVRASRKGTRLSGRFPYEETAVLSDGGRNGVPRKESFASRAFSFRVKEPEAEIHLLGGHSYDQPIASKLGGNLKLRDTDEALLFEAEVSPELESAPYWQNLLAQLRAGLIGGISPGFRLPPERAVPRAEAEEITDEPVNPAKGMHGALIRRIKQALLFELSLVTVPAYKGTSVATRSAGAVVLPARPVLHPSARWR